MKMRNLAIGALLGLTCAASGSAIAVLVLPGAFAPPANNSKAVAADPSADTERDARLDDIEGKLDELSATLDRSEEDRARLLALAERLAALESRRANEHDGSDAGDTSVDSGDPRDSTSDTGDGSVPGVPGDDDGVTVAPGLRDAIDEALDEREAEAAREAERQREDEVRQYWRERTDQQLATIRERVPMEDWQQDEVARILDETLDNFMELREQGMEAQARGESFDWSLMGQERERYLDEIRGVLDQEQVTAFDQLIEEEEAEAQRQQEEESRGAMSGSGWGGNDEEEDEED